MYEISAFFFDGEDRKQNFDKYHNSGYKQASAEWGVKKLFLHSWVKGREPKMGKM